MKKKYRFNTQNILKHELRKILNDFTDEIILGKEFIITVAKLVYKRTLKQNSLYWIWIEFLRLDSGNEKDDIHNDLKERFLEPQITTVFGRKKVRYTTTGLTTKQFNEYLEKIRLFVLDFTDNEIDLPYPDDKENFALIQEQIELLKI